MTGYACVLRQVTLPDSWIVADTVSVR